MHPKESADSVTRSASAAKGHQLTASDVQTRSGLSLEIVWSGVRLDILIMGSLAWSVTHPATDALELSLSVPDAKQG